MRCKSHHVAIETHLYDMALIAMNASVVSAGSTKLILLHAHAHTLTQINAWAWNHGYTLDNVGSADPADGTFAAGALALASVANLNPAAKLPLSGLWRWAA